MRWVRLSEISELITKGTTPTTVGFEFQENGISFLKIECFDEYGNFIESKVAHVSAACHAQLKRSQLEAGDILFSIAGVIGRVAIVTEEMLPANINQALAIIRIKRNDVYVPYVKLILTSTLVKKQFERKKQGVAQLNISLKDINDLEVPMPDIKQQIEHVIKFDKIAELINQRQNQLRALDTLIKARFVEMFGDTILNPFGWDKDLLGTVCDVRDGTHDSPQYYETGFPLVTSKNVTGGKIDLTDCSLICESDFNKINERSKVDMGDIIMPMIGTVGKPVIVDIEPNFAIKNVSLIKFRSASRVLNMYIHALLQSDYFDDAVLSKIRGGTQKFISLGDIRKLEVLVPPIERQEQYATFVARVDKTKAVAQKALNEMQLLFDSLMQKNFG